MNACCGFPALHRLFSQASYCRVKKQSIFSIHGSGEGTASIVQKWKEGKGRREERKKKKEEKEGSREGALWRREKGTKGRCNGNQGGRWRTREEGSAVKWPDWREEEEDGTVGIEESS